MADLSDTNSAQTTKAIGADSSGVEQTPVQSTVGGGVHLNLRNNAGAEIGTAANPLQTDVLSAALMMQGAKQVDQTDALNTLITNIGEPLSHSAVATGTIANTVDTVELDCEGYDTVQIDRTGMTGVLGVEYLLVYSDTWTSGGSIICTEAPATTTFNVGTSLLTSTRNLFNCTGYIRIRVRASVYISGTATIHMVAAKKEHRALLSGADTWSINSAAKNVSTDRTTYSAATVGLVPENPASIVFGIRGFDSGTTRMRITKISISGTKTSAGVVDVALQKINIGDGGTYTALTSRSHWSSGSGSGTIRAYTATPGGSGIEYVRTSKMLLGPTSAAVKGVTWEFGTSTSQALTLSDFDEAVCVSLVLSSVSGGSLDIYVEFVQSND